VHGLTAESSRDKLTSHFIGVESLLRHHAKKKGLVSLASKIPNDEIFPFLIEPLIEMYGAQAGEAIIKRGREPNPSDAECMDVYCADHNLRRDAVTLRNKSRRHRHSTLHGGQESITESHAKGAQKLIEMVLDNKLSVQEDL